MPSPLDSLLDQLERLKLSFTAQDGRRAEGVLSRLGRRRLPDATALIRFHEILLFMRAYPYNRAIYLKAEQLLSAFHEQVDQLLESGAEDIDALSSAEAAGIAGTSLSVDWGYDVVRHLVARHPSAVEIDWEGYREEALLIDLLKLVLPLFKEGAYVEVPIPYLTWIRAARGRNQSDLGWLLNRVEGLPISAELKSGLYDALKLYVRWSLGNAPWSRTNMRLPSGRIFYHKAPLMRRSDVSFSEVVEESSPLRLKKLTVAEGEQILSQGRDAMSVRVRELHGFTHGDPRFVRVADAGRGVRFFVWGLPPPRRLPLIGYHAALISKNGVPTGYAESLSLFERTEFGLNLFYGFREGESAWIFARLLRLFHQFLGVKVFSIEPYQIGLHNEEAIASGAFWFYRKLGFRPIRPDLSRITAREERRMETRGGYRTSARVLRGLAAGHLIYETPSSEDPGAWDHFHFRHIGLAVQRRMAERFDGDEQAMRSACRASVSRALGIPASSWSTAQRRALSDLAPALDLIPGLSRWSRPQKRDVIRIVRAKAGSEELGYLRLLHGHRPLRTAIIRIGSQDSPTRRSGRRSNVPQLETVMKPVADARSV